MKSIFLVCVVLIAIQFSNAEDSSNFILGGSNATIEEFPYMIGILTSGRFTCGGAIINSRSVLTVRIPSKDNAIEFQRTAEEFQRINVGQFMI